MIRRFPAVLLCGLCTALGSAQTPVPRSSTTAPAPEAKPSSVRPDSLPNMLSRAVMGQRVIAVGQGRRWDAKYPDEAVKKADKVLEKLQAVSEAASFDQKVLIPFAVRDTWIVAPETREEVAVGPSALSPWDLVSPQTLIDLLLSSLSTEQVRRLGTRQGIAATELAGDQQALLAHALRPPFQLSPSKSWEYDRIVQVDDLVDLGSVRVRAALEQEHVSLEIGGKPAWISALSHDREGSILLGKLNTPLGEAPNPPDVATVRNTFKPSDLDGKTFPQRFGQSGVMTVEEAVKRLAEVTRLKMAADLPFHQEPVFLGSPDLTCGDVIDGLRLGLTGAWRKLGDTYILAWDHRGLGALQRLVAEQHFAAQGLQQVKTESAGSPAWLDLAEKLPFAPGSAFQFTDAQRRKLLAESDGTWEHAPRIPFSEMTPTQQETIRREIRENLRVHLMDRRSGKPGNVTEADIETAYLRLEAKPQVQIQISGQGWRNLINVNQLYAVINNAEVVKARQRAAGKPRNEETVAQPARPVAAAIPRALYVSDRAISLPILTPGRLGELMHKAKRKGFTTVFYPALFDGYASFATTAFPLHPSLRGKDGWAVAAAAAKTEGLRLVATVDVLSWRRLGSRVHWMTKHPEWLDVDVAGRSRFAFLTQHPEANAYGPSIGPPADCVRPDDPSVEARLRTLLTDLARQPDVAGVAFADWRPGSGGVRTDPQIGRASLDPPTLGFTTARRLAAFRKDGRDPVDLPLAPDGYNPPPFLPRVLQRDDPDQQESVSSGLAELVPADDPWFSLAKRLMEAARQAKPGWRTYVYTLAGTVVPEPKETTSPKSEAIIFGPGDAAGLFGIVVPALPASALPETDRAALGGLPSIVHTLASLPEEPGKLPREVNMILLDFRNNPDEIATSLDWILPTPA